MNQGAVSVILTFQLSEHPSVPSGSDKRLPTVLCMVSITFQIIQKNSRPSNNKCAYTYT
jgi:hypothetical protein